MNGDGERVSRALDFCDRALDHLKGEEADLDEAVTLVEGIRNELLALAPEKRTQPRVALAEGTSG
jgi:hypothetical protein